jgi:cyanophycin synthetase
VVVNIAEGDHLGQYDILTREDMFKVKRTPVDVVLPTGSAVLNAADPLVCDMARLCAGSVIYFALDPELPVMCDHRAAGERWVSVRDGAILLGTGTEETPVLPLTLVPATHGGRVAFQVENVLAAVAAAWSLGVSMEVIQSGLQSFQGNLETDPARFNVLEISGRTLVVMDARNRSALAAVGSALDQFPHHRRTAVYSVEEDRRDAEIQSQAELLGELFDQIVLCEIESGVERPIGQVASLMTSALANCRRARHVHTVLNWADAVDLAWQDTARGEMLVVQSSAIPETVDKIRALTGAGNLIAGPSRRP